MSSTDYGTNPNSPLGGDDQFRPMPFVWRCAVCLRRQEFNGDVPDHSAGEN